MKINLTGETFNANKKAIMERGRIKFDPSKKLTEPHHAKTIRQQMEMITAGATLQGKALKGIYMGTSEVVRDPRSMDITEIQARREFLMNKGEHIKNEINHVKKQLTAAERKKVEEAQKTEFKKLNEKYLKQNIKKTDD